MASKVFNTLASEDWTVPSGATITYADFLGPGQQGSAVTIFPGEGGNDGDAGGQGGVGTADGIGLEGSPGECRGDVVLSAGEHIGVDVDGLTIQLTSGGGRGAFAGGGQGALLNFTFGSDDPPITADIVVGEAGENSFITSSQGLDVVIFPGPEADGDTPGVPDGSWSINADPENNIINAIEGDPGTAGSRTGGIGGIGGEFHRISSTPTALGAPGDSIRVVRDAEYTEIKNLTANKTIYRYGHGESDVTDYPLNDQESMTEKGGDVGTSTYGGGGASAQSHDNDGEDGNGRSGGNPTGARKGGDGGGNTEETKDGEDGATFGDGGGGAGPVYGAEPGAGQLGYAEIVYTVTASSFVPDSQLGPGIGAGL